MKPFKKIEDVLYSDDKNLLARSEHQTKGDITFFENQIRFNGIGHKLSINKIKNVTHFESPKLQDKKWIQVDYLSPQKNTPQTVFFMIQQNITITPDHSIQKDQELYQAFLGFMESSPNGAEEKSESVHINENHGQIISNSPIHAEGGGDIHIGNIYPSSQSFNKKEEAPINNNSSNEINKKKSVLLESKRQTILQVYYRLSIEKEYTQKEIAEKIKISPTLFNKIINDTGGGLKSIIEVYERMLKLHLNEFSDDFKEGLDFINL